MEVEVKYIKSNRHPRKPFRIEIVTPIATLDVHGRFASLRAAQEVGKDIGFRLGNVKETFSRLQESEMPDIVTEID